MLASGACMISSEVITVVEAPMMPIPAVGPLASPISPVTVAAGASLVDTVEAGPRRVLLRMRV